MDRPRIIVHELAHLRAALAAAAERGVAVTLVGPPAGVLYQGPAYLVEAMAMAQAEHPVAVADLVVDCGDAPGLALAALRRGAKAVRLRGDARALAAVADIARQHGARMDDSEAPALDLLDCAAPLAQCRRWLA